MERVLIISIDETNFRSDTIAKRQWQIKRLNEFDDMLKKKRINRLKITGSKVRKSRSLVYAKDHSYHFRKVKKKVKGNKRHRGKSETSDDEEHPEHDDGSW